MSILEQRKMVAHFATSDTELFSPFRHFKRNLCFICYTRHHSIFNCGTRKGTYRVKNHCELTGVRIFTPHISGLTFNRLDVAGHLLNVYGLTDTLEAATEKLKEDRDKVVLLTKAIQVPSRYEKV